ncbi:O-antigen ligase family protein [Allorhodopirellula solitaria]|uniref:O-antigen ligase-related domain-containing protein n=1 Tax=Allorhodopirellula solitaria TaxID=2527987 RepID=A0A5C5XW76_9BACT|nr:O-antigen ligase family protein [Allorhodopirellula solitaria]TWT66643.1 hypothetical protein CA85_27400 [Allorhodopirellula solitaria]
MDTEVAPGLLTDESSFAIMLLVSCGFAAWYGYRHGKQYVLGAGMAVSMLAGTWFEITLWNTEINVAMATAIVLLIAYCTHSWREIFKALNLLDVLVGALMIWHIIVDVSHEGQPLAFTLRAYGQWMLPYAAGRYAFLHPGSMSKLSPVFVAVASFIAIAAVYESFTSVNLWETIFIHVDDKVSRVVGQRYGLLYRSIGPVRNAIFLGIMLYLLLPFAVDLTTPRDDARWRRAAGFAGMILIMLGIVATVSRGPMLCVVLAGAFALVCVNRYARWILIPLAAAGVIFTAVQFDTVANYLESGGDEHTRSRIVDVDHEGDAEIHNNTRHRLLIPKIYGPIVFEGGPLGYGTTASSGFPPRNIPGLPNDPAISGLLRNVDNTYINIGLAFGWVGLALFVTLLITTIVQALQLAPVASTYLYPSDARVAVAYASIFFAIIFEIWTVHWSYDYSFWVLFQVGVVAGLTSQCVRVRRGEW